MSGLLPLIVLVSLSPPADRAVAPTVRADIPWVWNSSGQPTSYVPVVVTVESPVDQTLALTATCGGVVAHDVMTVRARELTRRTLLMPHGAPARYDCSTRVHWRTPDEQDGSLVAIQGSHNVDVIVIGTSPTALGGFTASDVVNLVPGTAPDRWQAYPLNDPVLVGSGATAKLSANQMGALTTWSIAGGRLVVSDTEAVEERWRKQGAILASRDAFADEDDNLSALAVLIAEHTPRGDASVSHRVPGTGDIPVGGFMGVALLFALLVGPLNLWWVIKRKKARHLFLITTPIFSIGACLLLFGYNVVAEGLHTRRSLAELTWLDAANHRAITWQGLSLFAGSGTDGLTQAQDGAVYEILGDHSGPYDHYPSHVTDYYGSDQTAVGNRVGVDWRGGNQQLSGGWVPSRRHVQLSFVTPHAERRRLTLTRQDGDYIVTNGLGVTVREVVWTAPDGEKWRAYHLAAGVSRPLEATTTVGTFPGAGRFGPGSHAVLERARQPGHFRAWVDAPLSDPPGPEATDEERPAAVVVGPLAVEQGAP